MVYLRYMKKESPLVEKIIQLIYQHINCYSIHECDSILEGLYYIFNRSIGRPINNLSKINLKDFQISLSKINEKGTRRKNNGVYYTPKDVTEYIVANSYLNFECPQNSRVYSAEKCIDLILKSNIKNILRSKVYDPTCGTAEFLISAFEIKLFLIKKTGTLLDEDILKIVSSLYGNDISYESILLSKIRMFFATINELKDKSNAIHIAKSLNKNFTVKDYVLPTEKKYKYDIIVGNPPYVEYNKLSIRPKTGYGNIYADVLQNSVKELKNTGVIGFVIPLSFVATSRMSPIRNFMYDYIQKMFVINYADRPDCLFDGVHQKLTILFGVKGQGKCEIFSSSYYHWYSDERQDLLNSCQVYPCIPQKQYIPKIGNASEYSIFQKIRTAEGISLLDIKNLAVDDSCKIYLNMRACFWMKAFSFNPGSKEYKEMVCPKKMQPYILAILNSSLFFMYWTIISDCWHITSKELTEFIVPIKGVDLKKFILLSERLEEQLEKTKLFIGSKQTQYEYKHKECKIEIDEIDNALQKLYRLTNDELSFIKEYKLKYRMSYGAI